MAFAVYLRIPTVPFHYSLVQWSTTKFHGQIGADQLRQVSSLFAECIKSIDAVLRQHLESILCDLFATLERQEMRTLNQVLDLTTIQLNVGQLVQACSVDVKLLVSRALDEVVPDLATRLRFEVSVREE